MSVEYLLPGMTKLILVIKKFIAIESELRGTTPKTCEFYKNPTAVGATPDSASQSALKCGGEINPD